MHRDVKKYLMDRGMLPDDRKVHPQPPSNHALRGTPIVGGGRSSAMWNSQPERELLRKEEKGRSFVVGREPLPASEPQVRSRKKLGRRMAAPEGRLW